MKASQEELERLEGATARGEPAAGLDAETARMREAWLTLGQLLEAAAPPAPPIAHWTVPPERRTWRWSGTAVIALAASLLLGVGATWLWPIAGQGRHSGVDRQQGIVTTVTRPADRSAPAVPAPTVPAPAAAPAWDDTLDAQLTQAGDAVARVSQEWNAAESPFAVVQYELEQTREDVMSSGL